MFPTYAQTLTTDLAKVMACVLRLLRKVNYLWVFSVHNMTVHIYEKMCIIFFVSFYGSQRVLILQALFSLEMCGAV
jgi:hypothetical protein